MLKPEQEEARKKYLGSSDMSAIVGVDPFSNISDVYLETRPVAIYAILDDETNVRYVGKSIHPHERFKDHKKRFKYKIPGVWLTILEWISPGGDWQSRERFWIDNFKNVANELGYELENKVDGGSPGPTERWLSRNARISRAHTGVKRPESGPAISRGLKGKTKGRKQSPEHIEARIAPLRNRKRPRELVERILAIKAERGVNAHSAATCLKISIALYRKEGL